MSSALARPIRTAAPLHRGVKETLADAVQRGVYADQLPSEQVLARDLGVSRTTLRNALLELERDGQVVRRHGIGTFVVRGAASVTSRLDRLIGFSTLIGAAGFQPAMTKLSIRHNVKGAAVARALERDEGSRFTVVSRVYLSDARPAGLVIDYVPPSPRFEEALRAFNGDMLPVLDAALGRRIERVWARVSAVKASPRIARELGVRVSSALVCLTHVIADTTGAPWAYTEGYLVPEIFTLAIVRQRE